MTKNIKYCSYTTVRVILYKAVLMVFISLTLLKTFAMTKWDRVGRIVPAERADSLLITLYSSFNELPTHGGAEGPVFSCLSSPKSSLMLGEE